MLSLQFQYGVNMNMIFLFNEQVNGMLLGIIGLAKYLNIDLFWHVEQKMRYNELRENKHGKKY